MDRTLEAHSYNYTNLLCTPQASDAGTEELELAMELELRSRAFPAASNDEPLTAAGRFGAWVLSFAVPGMVRFSGAAKSGPETALWHLPGIMRRTATMSAMIA